MKWIALLVILCACFFDPLQQVLLKGRYEGTVGWWHFHLVHFAAFYPPLIWIVLREYWNDNHDVPCGIGPMVDGTTWQGRILRLIYITVLAWATWQAGMLVSGAGWESMWLRWLKGLFP